VDVLVRSRAGHLVNWVIGLAGPPLPLLLRQDT